jgi:hypothetical protein
MGPGKGTDLEMGAIETPERLRELLPVLCSFGRERPDVRSGFDNDECDVCSSVFSNQRNWRG